MAEPIQVKREAVFSRLFGSNIARLRDRVAALLIRLHVKPNTLSAAGLLVTLAAGGFLCWGAGQNLTEARAAGTCWYGFWAGVLLILASACDMLDGTVARCYHQTTQLGAFLDSCFDRIADGAIFLGIMAYYLRHPETPRAPLWALASGVALLNAELISYTKARAENLIPLCSAGYWQRGERQAGILIGLFSGHLATVVAMLAVLAAFTVLRRLVFCSRQIGRLDRNEPLAEPRAPLTGIYRLALWRYRRGTLPYDITTAANICLILFCDLQRI